MGGRDGWQPGEGGVAKHGWRRAGACPSRQVCGSAAPQPQHAPRPPHPTLPAPPSPQVRNRDRAQRGEAPLRPLVLTAKSRADVVLALAAAHVTGTGPHVAGIILTDSATSVRWVKSAVGSGGGVAVKCSAVVCRATRGGHHPHR